MSAEVRPIRLLSDHALRSLAERAENALLDWAAQWSAPSASKLSVEVTAASCTSMVSGPYTEYAGAAGRLWVCHPSDQSERLAAIVLGPSFLPLSTASDEWSRRALDAAARERDLCLATSLVGEPDLFTTASPDASVFAFGSGAVHISCEALCLFAIADASVLIHVPPRDRVPATQPLSPLKEAMQDLPVSLTVDLGSVDVALSHLLSLEVGDVIRVPTSLADPLPVSIRGRPVASASLGHSGRHKAVSLVSLEKSSPVVGPGVIR